MQFNQAEPKNDKEKREAVDDAMESKSKPKGGTLHRMEIKPADNGFTVETTTKTKKSGKQRPGDFPGDEYSHDTTQHVFNDHESMIGHVIKHTKGE